MLEDKPEDIESKNFWNEQAKGYDKYRYELSKTLGDKIGESLWWERFKLHLPEDKNSKILDAGGGTGRITLPLANM